jgi:phage terminase small subunit
MPALRNAKHEAYAQALAKGKSATEAMEAAGYSDPRNSTRLTKNYEIAARVQEIKTRVAEKAEWTAADRLSALKGIYDAAASDDRRTAIAAIAEANRMQGSYAPTKHQHTGANGGPIQNQTLVLDPDKLKAMSNDELSALEAAIGKLHGSAGDSESRTDAEGDAEAYSGAIDGSEG